MTYTHDTAPNGVGRPALANASNSLTGYTGYDVLGRVSGSTQVSQSQSYHFGYGYNLAGSMTSETYPSGRTISTTYDGANRVSQVSGSLGGGQATYLNQISYAAHGGPLAYRYGNNLWRNVTYNSRLQASAAIDQLNNDPGQQLLNMSWNWGTTNNNGNLQGITQSNGGPGYPQFLTFNQSFSYDGVNRLAGATDSGGWSRSYQYDTWGNRWLSGNSGVPLNGSTPTTNVFNGNNQIAGVAYDPNGNQMSVNGDGLTFDAENRLIAVVESPSLGGGTETIQYDGNDQRVSKTVGSKTIAYVYDAMGQLAAEYSTGLCWLRRARHVI